MKQYSESTLMGMTKKELVQEVLIAYHNQNAAEATVRQQAVNMMDWEPVRHGTWEQIFIGLTNPFEARKCSECGYKAYAKEPHHYRFCPACGAKMDGGKKDET